MSVDEIIRRSEEDLSSQSEDSEDALSDIEHDKIQSLLKIERE